MQERPSWANGAVLVFNFLVVAYMIARLWQRKKSTT